MPTDTLFIGCNGHVAAIDPGTGAEIWRTKLKTGVISSTTYEDVCILEHEDRVYAGCNGHLFCLEGTTGTVLWHNRLEGMGHNEVTLAMAGKFIQFVPKQTHSQS